MLKYKDRGVSISDVLHDAADIFLAKTQEDRVPYYRNYYCEQSRSIKIKEDEMKAETYSCLAVEAAIAYNLRLSRYDGDTMKISKRVKTGLKNMGCPVDSCTAFKKQGDPPSGMNTEVQGMRYFWLKWAALMAEEQGV